MARRYTKKELSNIGRLIRGSPVNYLDSSLWNENCCLKIAETRVIRSGSKIKERWQFGKPKTTFPLSTCWDGVPRNCDVPKRNEHKRCHSNDTRARFALWNARSLKSNGKATSVCNFVLDNRIDILALTETWLTNSDRDNPALATISQTLPNFDIHHIPRSTPGGGVGVLLEKGFNVVLNKNIPVCSFEYIDLTVRSSSAPCHIRLVVIYRPPKSRKNRQTPNVFFGEFSTLLETLQSKNLGLLLAGDFNFHMDSEVSVHSQTFAEILHKVNLQNHVNSPTHRSNHTLDLIISRVDDHLVSNVSTSQALPSDHDTVMCDVQFARNCSEDDSSRSLMSVNIGKVKHSIK